MVSTREDVLALLDRVLSRTDASQSEALYIAQDSALTRFANNQIHQNVREHDASVQVRIIDAPVSVARNQRQAQKKRPDEMVASSPSWWKSFTLSRQPVPIRIPL